MVTRTVLLPLGVSLRVVMPLASCFHFSPPLPHFPHSFVFPLLTIFLSLLVSSTTFSTLPPLSVSSMSRLHNLGVLLFFVEL